MEYFELEKAMKNGDEPLAMKLVLAGADVNTHDLLGGYSMLHVAIEKDLLRVAELMIIHGANVNDYCGDGPCTPLGSAAISGRMPLVKLLLAHGAKLSTKEDQQWFYDELKRFGEHEMASMLETLRHNGAGG
jgi:ankyrin repeat protein